MKKNYCSRDCLLKDSEEKHNLFCNKGEEERKVKGGAKARVEARLKWLESGLEEPLKLEFPDDEKIKEHLVKVNELCKKQEEKGKKKKSEGGIPKRERGKK